MQELIEMRVSADKAHLIFRPDELEQLSSSIFVRVVLPSSDPRFPAIIELQRSTRAAGLGEDLIFGVYVTRKYSKAEWAAAELFRLNVHSAFEPVGEECGTQYDDTLACPVCGAGRKRVGPLRLNVRRIPKQADFAETIAGDEIVVSERVAEALVREALTGFELLPVVHQGKKADALPRWFEFRVVSPCLSFSPAAQFGSSPIDPANRSACPTGDTAGFRLLSQATMIRPSHPLSDFHMSAQYMGVRRGLRVPYRELLISPRAERLLASFRPRKLYREVAYFTTP